MTPVHPLLPRRERNRRAGEIDIESIQIVVLDQLAENQHLALANLGNGKVPVDLVLWRPWCRQQPLRVFQLHGNGPHRSQVIVRAIDPKRAEHFQATLARCVDENSHDVDSVIDPLAITGLVVERQEFARIGCLMPFSPAPPDAVDVAARVVGEGQAQLDQVSGGNVGEIAIAMDRIEVDHHSPPPINRVQMFWREFNRVCSAICISPRRQSEEGDNNEGRCG